MRQWSLGNPKPGHAARVGREFLGTNSYGSGRGGRHYGTTLQCSCGKHFRVSNEAPSGGGHARAQEVYREHLDVVDAVERLAASGLKVYGSTVIVRSAWNLPDDGQSGTRQARAVVAVRSIPEACRLMGITRGDWKHMGSTTGNDTEIVAAMSEVGTVFVRGSDDRHGPYVPIPKEQT